MASNIFNPQQPDKDVDYTDKSKGMTPDLSMANIFESVSTIGDAAIKGVNELFKTKIREEATTGVDAIRDREINMGAQQKGYGTQVPQEINTAANRLATMKNAKESGQIGDSHYFLLLDSEARRLRSRYPGHREYVDNVMQDLTGVTPANHAISMMKTELAKGDNKNNDLNNELHWARSGDNMPHLNPLNKMIAEGNTPDLATARAINAKHVQSIGLKKAFDSNLSTEEALRKNNEHKVEKHANEIIFGVQGMHDQAAMNAGGDRTGELAAAATAYRTGLEKGIVEPEARKALDLSLSKYKADSNDMFLKQLQEVRRDKDGNPYTLDSMLSPEARGRLESTFNKQIDMRIKAYKEGDVAFMSADADAVKASENTEILKLQREAPYMARVNAHRKLGGDQLTSLMLGESSVFMSAEHRLFQRYIIQGINNETGERAETTLKQAEIRMKEAGINNEDIANLKRQSIKGISDALASGKLTPEQTKATALWLYSGDPQNKDFYSKAGKYQDTLFKQLLQPRITETILNSNDQTIKDNYTKFVDTAVYNRFIGNQDVAGFTQIANLANTPSMHGVKYNQETKSFEPTLLVSKTPSTDRNVQTSNQGFQMAASKAANDLNSTMKHYLPIADKLGRDPNVNVTNMLTMHGLEMLPSGEIMPTLKPGMPKPVNTTPPKDKIEEQGDATPEVPVLPTFSTTVNQEQPSRLPSFSPQIPPASTLTQNDQAVNPTQERLNSMKPVTMDEVRKALEDQKAGREISPRERDAIDRLKRNIQQRPEGR